jgi:hypothetical protein
VTCPSRNRSEIGLCTGRDHAINTKEKKLSKSIARKADFEGLLVFLPLFEAHEGADEVASATADELTYFSPEVSPFIDALRDGWLDPQYDPSIAGNWLRDDEFIARANLQQVRSMLTCVVRGERFCDGYFADAVKAGRIGALLRRLAALQQGYP